jgi:hypothetical protein
MGVLGGQFLDRFPIRDLAHLLFPCFHGSPVFSWSSSLLPAVLKERAGSCCEFADCSSWSQIERRVFWLVAGVSWYLTGDEHRQLRDLIKKARTRRDAEMRQTESEKRPEVQTPVAHLHGQGHIPSPVASAPASTSQTIEFPSCLKFGRYATDDWEPTWVNRYRCFTRTATYRRLTNPISRGACARSRLPTNRVRDPKCS